MTPQERVKTAAILLERIDAKSAPAGEIINGYTASRRYIAGEDRKRLIAFIWQALEAKARLEYALPGTSWEEKLTYLEEKGIPSDSQAPRWVQLETPQWIWSHIPEAERELEAMLHPAPVVLRANGNRETIRRILAEEGIETELASASPFALILKNRAPILGSKSYKKGLFEIQDEGAQLLSMEIGVKPHESVFDFCAGAGGKSLIFAQLMNQKGFIQAYDASFKRLNELNKRARRAGVSMIKTVFKLPLPHKKFDHVVVDAPCSGTGTWRRNPDMRWKLTEKQLAHIVEKQASILETAQEYVKNGRFLSYITCSLTQDENESQIASFIKRYPSFHIVRQKRYSPARTQTDGFFLCVMQKR